MNLTWQAVMQLANYHPMAVLFVSTGSGYAVWKIAAWKTRVDVKLGVVDDLVQKVDKIYDTIVGTQIHDRSVAQTESPVGLSDFGAQLAKKINVDAIVDLYVDVMQKQTHGLNEYEIQEHCFNYCRNKLVDDVKQKHPEHFSRMSDVAFNEGVDMANLTYITGIKLRDRVLAEETKTGVGSNKSAAA